MALFALIGAAICFGVVFGASIFSYSIKVD